VIVRARASTALLLTLVACGTKTRMPDRTPPILLVSDRGGGWRIYEEIEGGSARLAGSSDASAPYSDTMPARLPEGGIVFVSDRDGNPEIYLSPAGGGALRLTADPTASPSMDSAPAPLGRERIVFARGEAGAPEGAPRDLYTMRLDGSDRRRLTRDPADDAEPWGSADGRAVVFVSGRTGALRVWLIPDTDAPDPEAGAVCLSAAGDAVFEDHGPVLLPDGSVVFSRGTAGGVSQIFVMGGDGARAGLRQITDPLTLPYGASEPCILDDRTILLTAGPVGGTAGRSGGGRFAVYEIALGGFNLARVTRDRAPYNDFARRLAGR
jgi:WD40 repeat protein